MARAAADVVKGRPAQAVHRLELDSRSLPARLGHLAGREGWWFAWRFQFGGLAPEGRVAHLVLWHDGRAWQVLADDDAAAFAALPARPGRGATGGAAPLGAATEEAVARLHELARAEVEGRSLAAFDVARERWDRAAEDALSGPRREADAAREAWKLARSAPHEEGGPLLLRERRTLLERAEREYRRRLEELRAAETARLAEKDSSPPRPATARRGPGRAEARRHRLVALRLIASRAPAHGPPPRDSRPGTRRGRPDRPAGAPGRGPGASQSPRRSVRSRGAARLPGVGPAPALELARLAGSAREGRPRQGPGEAPPRRPGHLRGPERRGAGRLGRGERRLPSSRATRRGRLAGGPAGAEGPGNGPVPKRGALPRCGGLAGAAARARRLAGLRRDLRVGAGRADPRAGGHGGGVPLPGGEREGRPPRPPGSHRGQAAPVPPGAAPRHRRHRAGSGREGAEAAAGPPRRSERRPPRGRRLEGGAARGQDRETARRRGQTRARGFALGCSRWSSGPAAGPAGSSGGCGPRSSPPAAAATLDPSLQVAAALEARARRHASAPRRSLRP